MSGGALREIIASFGFELDDKELKRGESRVNSFTENLKNVAEGIAVAFGVEKVVEFGKEILEEADSLAKLSEALSVSAADLQGWQWAAKLSGSSAEEFNSAFTKFNKNVAEAGKGAGPAADALKALGITTDQLKNKAPIDLLDGVADGLVAMHDPAKRTQTIMDLFGKSGTRLLPLFLEGAEGTKKLRKEVEELGFGFDAAFLENAQEVNDNVDRLKNGVKGLAIQAIGPMLPMLRKWTQGGVELIKQLIPVLKHSNAVKAALVAFAVGATAALAPLLLSIAPLVAGFLLLEDLMTFLSGGKSLTGDLLDKYFGSGAAAKVKAFAKEISESVMPVLKAAFAIFSSDEPLDQKFKDLNDYIENSLGPNSAAVFHEMVADIQLAVQVVRDLVDIVKELRDLMVTLTTLPGGNSLFNAGNFSPKALLDQNDSDQAGFQEAQRAGKPIANKASDFDLSQKGLFQQALAFVVGFKAEGAVPGQHPGQVNVASAPIPGGVQVHDIKQTNQATVNQYFTASTPDGVKSAAADGAKAGVNDGKNLRTLRALVPTAR